MGQLARPRPPIGCGCRESHAPGPAPRSPDAGRSIRTPGGPSSPQCCPSMTLRVTEVRPFRFNRAPCTRGPRGPGGGGGPGRRGARNGSWGAGVTPCPAPEPPESGAPNPAPPRARPRAGSRLPAAARRITPLAAARLVPGRSPDAHWPGRRSQAVSPCGVSARGRPRLNSAGAGLEGARETVAASPPPRAPSSLSFSRSHSRPRPYQVQAARPGRGRKL